MSAMVIFFNTDKFADDATARKAVAKALPQLAKRLETGEYVGNFLFTVEQDGKTHDLYGDVDER